MWWSHQVSGVELGDYLHYYENQGNQHITIIGAYALGKCCDVNVALPFTAKLAT